MSKAAHSSRLTEEKLPSAETIRHPSADIAESGCDGTKNTLITWQAELANMITNIEELLNYVGLSSNRLTSAGFATVEAGTIASDTISSFPLRVTRSFADRIVKGDAHDPLLLQVLPQLAESTHAFNYRKNPLQESLFQPAPGVLQKYHGRALLVITGACAIHCRYCFRRHFPYHQHRHNRKQWQQALNTICEDESLEEIILSGGDPLMLTDRQLAHLIEDIEGYTQIKTLRIHTRLPVVLPKRITNRLLLTLANTRLNTAIVIHSNHVNEITQEVGVVLQQLQRVANAMLNQTVLLKGVNNNSDVLARLSKKLFDYGTLPYYLHMLDRVDGAAHFETDEKSVSQIMSELRRRLPGYLVPRAVREIPGEPSKTPLLL